MVPLVGGLISKPLDLEHDCRDKGRDDEESHNGREHPVLDAWIQPDQRDQQQGRDAQSDGGKEVERVRWLSRRECLL